jgi:hypothetical protein
MATVVTKAHLDGSLVYQLRVSENEICLNHFAWAKRDQIRTLRVGHHSWGRGGVRK